MSSKIYLSLKDLFSEKLLRDVILFSFLFLLILAQEWDHILLLLFPLITFVFSIFFGTINANKWRTEFTHNLVLYHPLGSEQKNANRFLFCALLQLVLLFWYGAESLYHPQLVDNYFFLFITLLVFVYSFGFYWIFIDVWKYSKIHVILTGITPFYSETYTPDLAKNLEGLISVLNIKKFKSFSLMSFLIFIIINLLNVSTHLLSALFADLGLPTFEYPLPGTGIESSAPISLSYGIYASLIVSPALALVLLRSTYRAINHINLEKLHSLLETLPTKDRLLILENLRLLNRKLNEELRRE